MPCYHPLNAYKSIQAKPNGKYHICFKPKHLHLFTGIQLPCGQCVGCRLDRSYQWAIRCMHETSLHEQNSFITLTYDDKHLPSDGSVNVVHFQNFMKKLRTELWPLKIRFFHCGEYGEEKRRPHYHAIIFGYDFPDRTFRKKLPSGEIDYDSEQLKKIWKKGRVSVGNVTMQSCAYVARYIMKKVNGDDAEDHYAIVDKHTGEITGQLNPEYVTMSRRPGIGKKWYDKFKQEVFPADEVIVKKGDKNIATKPPKYYDGLYQEENPVYHAHLKKQRKKQALERKADNTPERLLVRETIKLKNLKQLKRELC